MNEYDEYDEIPTMLEQFMSIWNKIDLIFNEMLKVRETEALTMFNDIQDLLASFGNL